MSSMSRPPWFRRVHVPLTLVCGPPAAGKSSFVAENAGVTDLTIDFDQIASTLLGCAGRPGALSAAQVADVLRRRNDMIADLMRPAAAERWPAAWLIVGEPVGAHRQWWAERTGAAVVLLPTPAEICRARIAADSEAGDVRARSTIDFVNGWWRDFTPAACDQVVEDNGEAFELAWPAPAAKARPPRPPRRRSIVMC